MPALPRRCCPPRRHALQYADARSPTPPAGLLIFLRAWQLPSQLLDGDEWHALHRALYLDYSQLATSFGISDHSIALALYYRVAMDTVGLSDAVLRAPFLLCGALTFVLVPWAVERFLGRFVSLTLSWLLALSPLLVFYSRYARPYAVALACVFGGAFAFLAWWDTGRRRWASSTGRSAC
jgi:predicted membrane-bound mannosyltransferase